MRFGLTVIFLYGILKAQVPPGYYNATHQLYGISLKQALYNLIKNHRVYEYTSDTTDTWDLLKDLDRDSLNPSNVIEIYTGWSVNAAQEYNNGNGWEREHVWAKVHGGFDINPPAGTDVHHLRPIDKTINAARNSRWFAECNEPYTVGGLPSGSYYSTNQWVWKPRDCDKGDVARMLFYMAVRYEGENGEPDLELVDYLPAINHDPAPIMAKLSDLLQWHAQDPVDSYERKRNDLIYTKYQHNRNPFIDVPDFAWAIWDAKTLMQDHSASSILRLYPNTSSENWMVYNSLQNKLQLQVYSSLGALVYENQTHENATLIDIRTWAKGMYTVVCKSNTTVRCFKAVKIN